MTQFESFLIILIDCHCFSICR